MEKKRLVLNSCAKSSTQGSQFIAIFRVSQELRRIFNKQKAGLWKLKI